MNELGTCEKCGKSPWVHPLRGAWLFCNELGGTKSSFTQEQVNVVRVTIGKDKILTIRREDPTRQRAGGPIIGTQQ